MWGGTSSGNWVSLDATGYQFNPSSKVVVDRDGIQYSYGGTTAGQIPTQIQDSNGNFISATVSSNVVTGWTDTLGRSIPIPPAGGFGVNDVTGGVSTSTAGCPGQMPTTAARLWNLPGPSGGTYAVKVCFATVQINTDFPIGQGNPNYHQVNEQLTNIQSIVLPDGTFWEFVWDSADPNNPNSFAYGNLLKVILPTTGSISYTWLNTQPCSSGQASPPNTDFSVTSRTVNDGTTNQEWTYGGGVVTDPLQNQTVYTFTALGTTTCSLYETSAKYYQNVSGTQTLLGTVATQYALAAVSPWVAFTGDKNSNTLINVAPTSVTTTWANGQSVNVQTGYDAGVVIGSGQTVIYGNPVDNYEYDFTPSGGLLRHTHTTYKAFSTPSYLTAGLLDLPFTVNVYDGGGTQRSSTTYQYDETGLQPSLVTMHVGASLIPNSPRGNQTSVARWLSNGSATSTTSCPVSISNGGSVKSTAVFYDTGTVYQDTDPCTKSTTYAYSSTYYGAYPTTITNALSQSATRTYDFNTGLVTQTKDSNLQPTNFTYNSMWRIFQIGYPDTGAATFSYQVTTVPFSVTRTRTMTPTPSAVTTVVFDGLGRQTRRLSANGEAIPNDQVETCYDGLGRTSFVSYPYQGTGLASSHFCSGLGDSFLYDALGRTLSVTHSDGTKTVTSYTGSDTEISDEGNGTSSVARISQVDGLGSPGQCLRDFLENFNRYYSDARLVRFDHRRYWFSDKLFVRRLRKSTFCRTGRPLGSQLLLRQYLAPYFGHEPRIGSNHLHVRCQWKRFSQNGCTRRNKYTGL